MTHDPPTGTLHERPRRKTVTHFNTPHDLHELTFSCQARRPLLMIPGCRSLLARGIDAATQKHGFRLHAFVFMPEHVHLLVAPKQPQYDTAALLYAIKRPTSFRIKQLLTGSDPGLVKQLTVVERPGKTAFRFWLEGPGYDRNLTTAEVVRASIEYIHNNPVKRGLCREPGEWAWSSWSCYAGTGRSADAEMPAVEPFTDL